LTDLAREFVLVRVVNMRGVNLNVLDFDYDLEWAGLFLRPDETILGRFGGARADAGDPYLNLEALRYALARALERHRQPRTAPPPATPPWTVERYPAARALRGNACIHCHQVYDFRNAEKEAAGKWRKEEMFVYPAPDQLGLTLATDQGNRVQAVAADSAAARAGLRRGDVLTALNDDPTASYADVRHALHHAPATGVIPVAWQRAGKPLRAMLTLPNGWRHGDLSWRASLKHVGPDPAVDGIDLSAAEKQALGLPPHRLAFRQDNFVSPTARQAGIQRGDVILGVDGQPLAMTVGQFRVHLRLHHQPGDEVTFHLLRAGQRLRVPLALPRRP